MRSIKQMRSRQIHGTVVILDMSKIFHGSHRAFINSKAPKTCKTTLHFEGSHNDILCQFPVPKA
jgi:hypothetical protein